MNAWVKTDIDMGGDFGDWGGGGGLMEGVVGDG